MLRPIGLALRGRLSLVRVRPWAKRAQWTDFTAPSDAMNYFRIIWRRTATALMLSTAITIAACSAKSATNQSAARPVVRMATAEASILSAFLNFPQFSVQSTDIGDSEKRLIAVQQASVDLAVTSADVTYLAFNGLLPGRSQPMDRIRGIRPAV